jgi:hypothetical protein
MTDLAPPRPTSPHLARGDVGRTAGRPRPIDPIPVGVGRGQVGGSGKPGEDPNEATSPGRPLRSAAFISTPAKPDTCQQCGQLVLTALADGCAIQADPYAVTVAGELAARITGRMSFFGINEGGRILLHTRTRWDIVGGDGRPVFVRHQCGQPPGGIDDEKTREVLSSLLPDAQTSDPIDAPF